VAAKSLHASLIADQLTIFVTAIARNGKATISRHPDQNPCIPASNLPGAGLSAIPLSVLIVKRLKPAF
jgi:hypothetical protein